MTAAGVLLYVASPGFAQTEIELGGGYHVNPDIADLEQLPSGPAVDARVVRWLEPRWGIGVRFSTVFGSVETTDWGRDGGEVVDRYGMTYGYLLVRYRLPLDDTGTDLHLGVGAIGAGKYRDRNKVTGTVRSKGQWLGLAPIPEVFVSKRVTDLINVRVGIVTLPPVIVHPVVLVTWKLGN